MNVMIEQYDAIASAAPKTPAEFVRWVSEHDELEQLRIKLELSHGQVSVDVINTTRFHSSIILNLNVLLVQQLDRKAYSIHGPDFAVQTPFGIRGPDTTVDRKGGTGKDLIAHDPIALFEVTSPTSLARDFYEKPKEYFAMAGVRAYVVFAQDEARAFVWQRDEDGNWPREAEMLAGLDKSIEIRALGITLPLSAIYGDLDFGD